MNGLMETMEGWMDQGRDRSSSFVSAAESLERVKRERLTVGDRRLDQTHMILFR